MYVVRIQNYCAVDYLFYFIYYWISSIKYSATHHEFVSSLYSVLEQIYFCWHSAVTAHLTINLVNYTSPLETLLARYKRQRSILITDNILMFAVFETSFEH